MQLRSILVSSMLQAEVSAVGLNMAAAALSEIARMCKHHAPAATPAVASAPRDGVQGASRGAALRK